MHRLPSPPTFALASTFFLRALGLVYLTAFVSLYVQIPGLYGEQGISPVSEYLRSMLGIAQERGLGWSIYRYFPTLLWLWPSEEGARSVALAGGIGSFLLLLGVFPRLVLVSLWALYLSLVSVGQSFLAFQWDNLLLETGFLAIFLPSRRRLSPHPWAVFLLHFLLFRLMFFSGLVKLWSQDPTWWGLTALGFHYESQPLPTWVGWYAHHLPLTLHKASAALMFGIEIIIPVFILAGGVLRRWAFGPLVALQILIALTGNYGFFNLLTLTLCLLLLDDAFLRRFLPTRIAESALSLGLATPEGRAEEHRDFFSLEHLLSVKGVACVCLFVLGLVMALLQTQGRKAPSWLSTVGLRPWIGQFRSVNRYGLFASMTTDRKEIQIEGSDDGITWKVFELPWKPGDPMRPPPFVGPHMPRLDWQLWFAALGDLRQNAWLSRLLRRLQEGSPAVFDLFHKPPFSPSEPPRYVRAMFYRYRFTKPLSLEAPQRQGLYRFHFRGWSKTAKLPPSKTVTPTSRGFPWWERQILRPYSPVFTPQSR